jgi:Putative zinc-finger
VADESKFGQKAGSTLQCEEWEAQLTDALDGLLPAGQAAAFHAHSETCANCGDLLAHAKQGQEWLGYLHTEPEIPSGLIGKILEKTVGASGVPLPVVAAGAGGGAVAMATPWRRSFHETRLLMTVAMAFFSIALTLNLMGVKPGSFKLADLKPAEIGNTISRQFYGARSSVVRYYDHLRFVYELESRTRELRRDVESTPQTQPSQQQQNQQQKPQQSKPGNGSARSEPGTELRAQSTEEGPGIRD